MKGGYAKPAEGNVNLTEVQSPKEVVVEEEGMGEVEKVTGSGMDPKLSLGLIEEFRELLREACASVPGLRALLNPRPLSPKRGEGWVAVDGSYRREKVYGAHLLAAWTVAVHDEGETWRGPWVALEVGGEEASTRALRAFTLGMEVILLAEEARGKKGLLDGSMATPLIYLSQGLEDLKGLRFWQGEEEVAFPLGDFLEAYKEVLLRHVAVPKRTTGGPLWRWLEEREVDTARLRPLGDKGLLEMVLRPGEWVGPFPLGEKEYYLEGASGVLGLLKLVRVHYLKTPSGKVVRVEGLGLSVGTLEEVMGLTTGEGPLPLALAHELASGMGGYVDLVAHRLWEEVWKGL